MQRRNWLDLSRKLVDRYDLDDVESYIAAALGVNVLALRRYGIVPNPTYPSPFQTTLSGSNLTATVTGGQAFDEAGQVITVPTTQNFAIAAGDPSHPRWDLLVLRYTPVGITSIPKPSDPSLNVFLDLEDGFTVAVIQGTPSASPAYPAALVDDVILMGLKVPTGATLANQATEDPTVRDQGLGKNSIKTVNYTVTPNDQFVGMDATSGNKIFTLTKFKFAEGSEWTLQKVDGTTNTVTINTGAGGDVFLLDGSTPTSLVLNNQGESLTLKVVGGVCYVT